MQEHPLTNEENDFLLKIYELARDLENRHNGCLFSSERLEPLIQQLQTLQESKNENLRRLAKISDHLSPEMSLQHFVNFILPIERLLDRSLRDDDFLISTEDHITTTNRRRPLYFILDNLRSAFNVGSVFRLADGMGASEVHLCGYTPTPESKALIKTSMSTVDHVPWSHHLRIESAIKYFLEKKISVVALETSQNAKTLHSDSIVGPTAFLVGNERFGLDRKTLSMATEVRKIPLYGIKNSLNVTQSLAMAAFEWSRQNP